MNRLRNAAYLTTTILLSLWLALEWTATALYFKLRRRGDDLA